MKRTKLKNSLLDSAVSQAAATVKDLLQYALVISHITVPANCSSSDYP